MSREVTTKIKCDVCGNECKPFTNDEIILGWFMMQEPSKILKISYRLEIPYGKENGDICKECIEKSIREHYRCIDKNIGDDNASENLL